MLAFGFIGRQVCRSALDYQMACLVSQILREHHFGYRLQLTFLPFLLVGLSLRSRRQRGGNLLICRGLASVEFSCGGYSSEASFDHLSQGFHQPWRSLLNFEEDPRFAYQLA